MTNATKTLLFVVVAAGLFGLAWLTNPGTSEPEFFSDEGEVLFPDFTNPTEATSLEVLEYQEALAGAKPFKVHFKDGRWSIPSHHDYAADAKDRMAKAAALVIGMRKEEIQSDNAADHDKAGVKDPTEGAGGGKLITFRDAASNELAWIIVGNKVDENGTRYYVRLPGKKRIYVSEVSTELSNRFEDWIETDLLQLEDADLTKAVFDNYSIDEVNSRKLEGEHIEATHADNKWAIADLAPDEEIDTATMTDFVEAVENLKIVGVRKKPAGLSAQLTRDNENMAADNVFSLNSLIGKGFFLARDGNLYANEGDLYTMTAKGIEYTLRFGEIIYGVGDDVTAGSETEGAPPSGTEPNTEAKANRYLMVTARFDPALLDQPGTAPLPEEHRVKRKTARKEIEKIQRAVESYKTKQEALPESLTQLTEGDDPPLAELAPDPWGVDYVYAKSAEGGFTILSYAEDKAEAGEGPGADIASDAFAREDEIDKVAQDFDAFQRQVKDGEELASKLRERFAPWYYVISDDAFKSLRLGRDQIVKKKEAEKPTDSPTPGPGNVGPPSLPPRGG